MIPIIRFLKIKEIGGCTLSYKAFEKDSQIINERSARERKKIKATNIKILKDIHNLGMLSAQIINVDCFKKIEKSLNKKILLEYGYPHVYIVLKIIEKFSDWQKIENIIVYYRSIKKKINIKDILYRLDIEFKGYGLPMKEIYDDYLYKKLFKKVFVQNIISWILFSLEYAGKKKTLKILEKNKSIYLNITSIFLIKILILLIPIKLILFIKKTKNLFFKKIN